MLEDELNQSMIDDLIVGYLSNATNLSSNMKDLSDLSNLVFSDKGSFNKRK